VAATNETGVQELFRLLDGLKNRYEIASAVSASAAPKDVSLKARYPMAFFFEPLRVQSANAALLRDVPGTSRAGEDGDDGDQPAAPAAGASSADRLQRAAVSVTVSAVFDEKMRLILRKGQAKEATAHWLNAAVEAIQRCLDALDLAVALRLTPELEQLLQESRSNGNAIAADGSRTAGPGSGGSRGARRGGGDFMQDALSALRSNLVEHSPLVQGKGRAFPNPAQAADSVFSLKERHARALSLLGREWAVGPVAGALGSSLSPAQLRAAMDRLRVLFVERHDALQLYHALWPSLQLRIGGPAQPYYADVPARTFCVPCGVEAAPLLDMVSRFLPPMVEHASRGIGTRLRAEREAEAARQKEREARERKARAQAYAAYAAANGACGSAASGSGTSSGGAGGPHRRRDADIDVEEDDDYATRVRKLEERQRRQSAQRKATAAAVGRGACGQQQKGAAGETRRPTFPAYYE
jgi:hypothetical protein